MVDGRAGVLVVPCARGAVVLVVLVERVWQRKTPRPAKGYEGCAHLTFVRLRACELRGWRCGTPDYRRAAPQGCQAV